MQRIAPSARIEFIDAVRGIAALLVLSTHLFELNVADAAIFTHQYLRPGTIGVAAFFLVSGFVIPLALERNGQSAFWVNRLFRIYPLYLTVLLLSVLCGVAGLWPWRTGIDERLAQTLVLHLPIVQGLTGGTNFVGGSWTLFIELVFYASFSLAAILHLSRRLGLLLLLANGAVLALVACGLLLERRIPLGYPCLLLCSFTGVAFYRHFRGETGGRSLACAIGAAVATTGAAFWYNYVHYPNPDFTFACAYLSWLSAFSLFGGFYLLRARSMPRTLIWLGTMSYGVYLCHDLINFNAVNLLGAGWWNLALVPALVLPTAWLAHHLIELPGIRVGKQLGSSTRDTQAAVAPPEPRA